MATSKTEKTTTEEPAMPKGLLIGAAAVLAVVGGLLLPMVGPNLDKADPVEGMINLALACAGIMLGAGLGLTLADFKKTTTTESTTTGADDVAIADAGPGQTVVTETLKIIKDLTPGKMLIVLSVTLIGLSLWAVTPAKPVTQITVEQSE